MGTRNEYHPCLNSGAGQDRRTEGLFYGGDKPRLVEVQAQIGESLRGGH